VLKRAASQHGNQFKQLSGQLKPPETARTTAALPLFPLASGRPCASKTLRATFGHPSNVQRLYLLSKYLADTSRSPYLVSNCSIKDRELPFVERL
jgi:hypothetical protein